MSAIRVLASAPSSPLSRLVEDYLVHCRARGLSPRTVDISYGYALRSVFLPWSAEHGLTRVEELDSRAVDRFTANLLSRTSARGRPLSKHSVHTYVRGVRQFLTWAQREGEPVSAKPQLPKLSKRHRDVLSREEIDRMEAAVPADRDKLIIRLFADCGLRLGEVTRLGLNDLLRHERYGQLRIQGKGDRERRVPVPPKLLRRLERHIEGRPTTAMSDRIFLSLRRGPSGDYDALTESGVAQLIGSAGARAGLGRSVHPHLMRHSWMTEMLRRGMNPIQLSVIAGASEKVIANHYEHLTEDDAFEAMMRALTSADRRPL